MKKLLLNKGLLLAFVFLFSFLAVKAEAAPLTDVDMLSARNNLYVADKASGDIYIFDIAKKGEFIKKISLGVNTQPSHMIYVYDQFVLVALSNDHKIAVINNTSLTVVNYIQTPGKPFYLANEGRFDPLTNSKKIVFTASKNNNADYLSPITINISLTSSSAGVDRTPGTADFKWIPENDYFTGGERIFTFINNQSYPNFMIFHDMAEVASETYELYTNGEPIKMRSDTSWTQLSQYYADFSVDHDFYAGYYVGKLGNGANKIQQMSLRDNLVVTEKTLPDSSYVPIAVSLVNQGFGDTLYVGVKSDSASGANLGVFSYDIVHGIDPTAGSAINIKHRFTFPSGEQVLERGVEGIWHTGSEAFAVTANSLYHLSGGISMATTKKYDFNTQPASGGIVNKPDLVVSNISYLASKYLVNEYGKLSVTITNNGTDLTISDGLKGYQDDADFASFSTNLSQVESSRALPTASIPLKTGESITFSWQGKFLSAGDNYLKYHVDSKNNLVESNETNNSLTKTIVIKEEGDVSDNLPDLVVSDLQMKDNSAGGKSLDLYIKNIGDALVFQGEIIIKVTVNNDVWNPFTLSLTPNNNVLNQNIKLDQSIHLNEPGDYVVRFEIDPENLITEKKEDNNVYTKRFSIVSKDDSQSAINDRAKITLMLQAASDLINENYDRILFEIKEVRDEIRENNVKLRYLNQLLNRTNLLNSKIETVLNRFIAYGVDNNTKRLGEGERAAVIHSYYAAYSKLPETEDELADAIKIANGRWPSEANSEAEVRAKEHFMKVYKKIPDMRNPHDNAAVVIIAYGLRQSAENRNLDSERAGIQTFINIYGYHPKTTIDWNIMQAITYSGATRGIDSDGDFLIDEREIELGTDPNNPDSDGDGFPDGIEVLYGYCPLSDKSISLDDPACPINR